MHMHNLMLSCALSNVCCIYKKEKDVNRLGIKNFLKAINVLKLLETINFSIVTHKFAGGKKKF